MEPVETVPKPEDDIVDPTNLIVNYLPVSVTEESLRGMFAPFGPIERVKLMTDKKTGQSATYGFVKFEKPEDARRAIEQLNGLAVEKKKLRVSYSKPHTDVSLYVGNLEESVTEEQLRAKFEQFGTILECKILIDPETRKSRGCGFVRFEKRESGVDAIGGLKDMTLPGFCSRPLTVRVANPRQKEPERGRGKGPHRGHKQEPLSPGEPKESLFVLGVPSGVSAEAIEKAFGTFGSMQTPFIKAKEGAPTYSYVIVTYDHLADAVRAQKALEKAEMWGSKIQVTFKSDNRK